MSNPSTNRVSDSDDNIIYVDLNMNLYQSGPPLPISREIQKTQPIIAKQGDYFAGVVRANFPCSSIPMWIAELKLGQVQNPPLETNYTCAMSYDITNGAPASLYLIRTVLDSQLTIPSVPVTAQPTNEYAFIYNIETIVAMINNALTVAFNNLVTAGAVLPAGTIAPYITFEASTQLMTINCYPYSSYDQFGGGNPVKIWFGASFIPFLAGFELSIFNTNPAISVQSLSQDALIVCGRQFNSYLDLPSAQPNPWIGAPGQSTNPAIVRNNATALMKLTQAQDSTGVFRALQRIQITTSGLNARLESVDAPIAILSSTTQNLTSSVLCDFTPDYTSIRSYRDPLVYTPASVIPGCRFIELLGSNPLQNFTISVFWTDCIGNQHPMLVQNQQQTASMKIAFVRKELLNKLKKLT